MFLLPVNGIGTGPKNLISVRLCFMSWKTKETNICSGLHVKAAIKEVFSLS